MVDKQICPMIKFGGSDSRLFDQTNKREECCGPGTIGCRVAQSVEYPASIRKVLGSNSDFISPFLVTKSY